MRIIFYVLAILSLFGCTNRNKDGNGQHGAHVEMQNEDLKNQKITYVKDSIRRPKYNSERLYLDTIITGNFNSEKGMDTFKLLVPIDPKDDDKIWNCHPCITKIESTDGKIILYQFEGDIENRLENVEDLDKDGIDEIAYVGNWFNGCWRTYELFTLKNKTWVNAGGMEIHVCADIHLKKRFKPIGAGKVIMYGDDATGNEKELSKTVDLKTRF